MYASRDRPTEAWMPIGGYMPAVVTGDYRPAEAERKSFQDLLREAQAAATVEALEIEVNPAFEVANDTDSDLAIARSRRVQSRLEGELADKEENKMNTEYVYKLARRLVKNGNMGSLYVSRKEDYAIITVTRDGTDAAIIFDREDVRLEGNEYGRAVTEVVQAAKCVRGMPWTMRMQLSLLADGDRTGRNLEREVDPVNDTARARAVRAVQGGLEVKALAV